MQQSSFNQGGTEQIQAESSSVIETGVEVADTPSDLERQPLIATEANAIDSTPENPMLKGMLYLLGTTACAAATGFNFRQVQTSEILSEMIAACQLNPTEANCGGNQQNFIDSLADFNTPGINAMVFLLLTVGLLLKSAYSSHNARAHKLIAAIVALLLAGDAAILIYFAKMSQIAILNHALESFPPTNMDLLESLNKYQSVGQGADNTLGIVGVFLCFFGLLTAMKNLCPAPPLVTIEWTGTNVGSNNRAQVAPTNYGSIHIAFRRP